MKCKGRLCPNFVISNSVTVSADNLTVNIPSLACLQGCLVIAQTIPDTATINLPVVITVGTDTTEYPLVDKCGVQLSAGCLDVRTSYPYHFISANTQSIFKICGARCRYNALPGLVLASNATA